MPTPEYSERPISSAWMARPAGASIQPQPCPAMRRPSFALPLLALLAIQPLAAQSRPVALDSATLSAFRWRNVGPANMGGRIADIEGLPSPSKTFYVAAAAGGIWKTINGGVTFKPIFDNQRVISMGDIAIAPSDSNTIYVGTGEQNSRNSISPGGGVYKATDGGTTWQFMGLKETEQIGRIVVDPQDPNTAYVAALGAAWRSNKERGLYKTTDGGKNWALVKFISDKAGFIDVALDPRDAKVVWASSYERARGPYFLNSGGPGSALWKSTDAGATWAQVQGGGFPATMKGRINIAIARSNPDVMYTMVEADTAANAVKDPSKKPQQKPSGLYRSQDGGKTWERTNNENTRPFYYSQVRVDPKNPDRVYWSSTPVKVSDDGGKTAKNATQGIHVDHHAMWIDPNDPEHYIVGNDGGIAITWDKGGTYDFVNTFAVGQFYNVSFDMQIPYRVCGGLQDNGSWCGPSRRRGAITNTQWFNIGGGDGFVTAQDPANPDILYSESQGGNIGRVSFSTGERTNLVKPSWRQRYTEIEDSIIVERGDTTAPESPAVKKRIADLRARQKQDSMDLELRWNWNTPYFLSPHSPNVFYAAANRVMKSTSRGDNMFPISPDLTTRDTMKIRVSIRTTGGITTDATGAETYSTIVSLNESPMRPGILYAGTDDGNVWVSKSDGASWDNLTGRCAGVPKNTYVSRIEPSAHDSNTFYITFDNHRNGDFAPYVYVTNDFGRTFRSIVNNLPTGGPDFVYVIREDPHNRDLLFVGTDVGAYVSLDRGATWTRFMTGLPTVPVNDLRIHPRDHELIAATHGRAIWIVDIAALEQVTADVVASTVHLFVPKTAYEYGQSLEGTQMGGGGGGVGHKLFEVQSPVYGADITYRVASGSPQTRARIAIIDASGDTIRTLNGPGTTGIQRVTWDFRGKATTPKPLSPAGVRDSIRSRQRLVAVLDSLEKSGMDKALIDRARGLMNNPQAAEQLAGAFAGGGGGGGGGGRGGAGGANAPFNWRPGEVAAAAGGRGGAGAAAAPQEGAGEGAGGAAAQFAAFAPLQDALRGLGIGGGGGGGGGGIAALFGGGRRGAAPLVSSGDYKVVLILGGDVRTQMLRVERIGNITGAVPVFGTDEYADEEENDDPKSAAPVGVTAVVPRQP